MQYNVPAGQGVTQNQSAMYKSPMTNFENFYKQVFEKENANNKSKKSYFDFNNGDVSVRVPHDTIIHDKNKHKMSVAEWEEILNNLNKPVDAVISSKPRFDGQPVLLKIISGAKTYGAVVEFFNNKQPIITTAFVDKEANIDKWLNKNRSAQAKNTSSITSKGMLLSQDHNTIMTYLQDNFKPILNTYYQKTNESFINKIRGIFSKKDKTIFDFQNTEEYKDIKDFFEDVKEVQVKNLTKDIAKQLGVNENNLSFYNKNNNTIYINYSAAEKLSPTAFNHSLFHEIIHAKQNLMYQFALENLNNNTLSSEAKNELKTYIYHIDKARNVVFDFMNYIKRKNVSDVSQLDNKGLELYNKYKFASTEIDADNFAIALQYLRGERNDRGLQQFNRGLESGRDSSYFRGAKQDDGIQKRTYEAIKEFNARQKYSNERLSDYTTYYQEINSNDNQENKKLIAGYTYPEVMKKLTSIWEEAWGL